MVKPGTVVTVDFLGAQGVKRRPALVVSTDAYHAARPDVVLAAITSQTGAAAAPTDYVLQDWVAAGLHLPSAFRSYFATLSARSIVAVIGQLSARDWREVQAWLRVALAIS